MSYGQLELRVLAHMTGCQSMIQAFQLGGDFHSRTAYGMYPHIKEAVASGKCILEWDGHGKAPLPLVKDLFGSERRKAKILNFSIAYGKTVHGLASDFGVSKQEAMETVERWYSDRPEVKEWQEHQIQQAKEHGWTRTLMGRYRPLPDILHTNKAIRGHNERAAINTPIQGGAADIVMMAMLKIHSNHRFREMGWKIIHDEIICEGPEEHTEEAMSIVRQSMQYPFKNPLLVDLTVDAKADYTWYKAK
jgi:DNA polymerase-1